MTVTQYVWDQDNIAYETDGNDAITAEYTYSPEQYGELISEYRNGETYTHYYDAQGSTLAMTDETGHVTDRFTYNAWGQEVARTGTTDTPWRWIAEFGYYFDSQLDSFTIRRRSYVAQISRWTSIDPAEFIDSLNRFLYAISDPLNQTDPSGTSLLPITPGVDNNIPVKSVLCGGYSMEFTHKFTWNNDDRYPIQIFQKIYIFGHYTPCKKKYDGCDEACTEDENKVLLPTCVFYERMSTVKEAPSERDLVWRFSDEISRIPVSLPECPTTKGKITSVHDIRIMKYNRMRAVEWDKWLEDAKRSLVRCHGIIVSAKKVSTVVPPYFDDFKKGVVVAQGGFEHQIEWNCCTNPPTQTLTVRGAFGSTFDPPFQGPEPMQPSPDQRPKLPIPE
jgi:RHS repeat-associated protein